MLQVPDTAILIQPEHPKAVPPSEQLVQSQVMSAQQQLWAASQISQINIANDGFLQTTQQSPASKTVLIAPKSQTRFEKNQVRLVSHEDAIRGRGYLSKLEHERMLKEKVVTEPHFNRVGRDKEVFNRNQSPIPRSEIKGIPKYDYTVPRAPTTKFPKQEPMNVTIKTKKEEMTIDHQDGVLNYKSIQKTASNATKPSAVFKSPDRNQSNKIVTNSEKDKVAFEIDQQKMKEYTRTTVCSQGSPIRSPLKQNLQSPPKKFVPKDVQQQLKPQSPWREWGIDKDAMQTNTNKNADAFKMLQQLHYEELQKQHKINKQEQNLKQKLVQQEEFNQRTNPNYFPNATNINANLIVEQRPGFNSYTNNSVTRPDLVRLNSQLINNEQKTLDTKMVAKLKYLNKTVGQKTITTEYAAAIAQAEARISQRQQTAFKEQPVMEDRGSSPNRTKSPQKPQSSFAKQFDRASSPAARIDVGLLPTESFRPRTDRQLKTAQDQRVKLENQIYDVFKYPNGSPVSKNMSAQLLDKISYNAKIVGDKAQFNAPTSDVKSVNDLRPKSGQRLIQFDRQSSRNIKTGHRGDQPSELIRRIQEENQEPFTPDKQRTVEECREHTELEEQRNKKALGMLSTERKPITPSFNTVGRETISTRGAVCQMTNLSVPVCTALVMGDDGHLEMSKMNKNNFKNDFGGYNVTEQYIQTRYPKSPVKDFDQMDTNDHSRLVTQFKPKPPVDIFYENDSEKIKRATEAQREVGKFNQQASREQMQGVNKQGAQEINDFVYQTKRNLVEKQVVGIVKFDRQKGRE
ncbi:Conserved_hypothetical protein [Hexamita inflata]|uniref:Uncharacterized protein n=1 Tax=Hexamita inflata TaxID=28002 RepID=A0ABP1K2A5_9EUKA